MSTLLTERARLIALVMHRGSERLVIEHRANEAAEAGEPDDLYVYDRALDGNEQAWREALFLDLVRSYPEVERIIESWKAKVHVEVRST